MTPRIWIPVVCLAAGLFAFPKAAAADDADVVFADEVVTFEHRYLLFTPDDKHLLAFSADAGLHVWDVGTGKRLQTLWLPRHMDHHHFDHVSISPDGRRLAVPDDKALLVLDLAAGRVVAVGRGHTGWIADAAFSPDGGTVATVGHDRLLKLWDPETGKCRETFAGPGRGEFRAVAWSPDGTRLATTEIDGPLRLWDLCKGSHRELNGATGGKLLWRPDGRAVVLLRPPLSCSVVDLAGTKLVDDAECRAYDGGARFDRGGRLLVSSGAAKDEDFRLADALTRREATAARAHPQVGRPVAVSANGELFAHYGPDGELVVRSLADGKVRMRTPGRPRERAATVGWSADGKSLVWTPARSGPFPQGKLPLERSFDLTRLTLGAPARGAQRTGAVLKDAGREIFDDGRVYGYKLRRTREGKTVTLEPSSAADDFYIHSVTLLAGERAALSSDWGLALHDTTTGKELFYYHPAPEGNELAAAPDGMSFATNGRTIGVYPTAGRERLVALYVLGGRWVAWGPGGYYAADWDGDLPVGCFTDRGPERLSEFVPLNRLKGRDRPDVIRRLLSAGSLEKAPREADASK
jgi:hypothetical protein